MSLPKNSSIKMEKDTCCKIKHYFIALFCRIVMHSLSSKWNHKPAGGSLVQWHHCSGLDYVSILKVPGVASKRIHFNFTALTKCPRVPLWYLYPQSCVLFMLDIKFCTSKTGSESEGGEKKHMVCLQKLHPLPHILSHRLCCLQCGQRERALLCCLVFFS